MNGKRETHSFNGMTDSFYNESDKNINSQMKVPKRIRVMGKFCCMCAPEQKNSYKTECIKTIGVFNICL